jgi:hypothetical protein
VSTLVSGHHGVLGLAWLLPSLGVSLAALALSSQMESRRAGAIVGGVWVAAVVMAGNVSGDPVAAFRGAGQLALGAVAIAAAVTLFAVRTRFDTAGRGGT